MTGVEFTFNRLAVLGHGVAECPVDDGTEDVTLDRSAPFRLGSNVLYDAEEIEQADDQYQGGVLEQGNETADDAGNDVF